MSIDGIFTRKTPIIEKNLIGQIYREDSGLLTEKIWATNLFSMGH